MRIFLLLLSFGPNKEIEGVTVDSGNLNDVFLNILKDVFFNLVIEKITSTNDPLMKVAFACRFTEEDQCNTTAAKWISWDFFILGSCCFQGQIELRNFLLKS